MENIFHIICDIQLMSQVVLDDSLFGDFLVRAFNIIHRNILTGTKESAWSCFGQCT